MTHRVVILELPDGSQQPYEVPEGMSDVEVKARHYARNAAAYAEDAGKAGWRGAVSGVREGLDWPRRAANWMTYRGMQGAGKLLGSEGLKNAGDYLEQGTDAVTANLEKGEKALTGGYTPKTKLGEYAQEGARGLASALPTSKAQALIGALTGVATKAGTDAGLGPVATTGIAFGLPTAAAFAKQFLPKVAGKNLASSEVKQVLGPNARSELQASEATRAAAERAGVPLLPGQSFAPGSQITGLQERAALASPKLQEALREQAGIATGKARELTASYGDTPSRDAAQKLKDAIAQVLERRVERRQEAVKPLYSQADSRPLTFLDAATVSQGLEKVKQNRNIARKTDAGKFVDNVESGVWGEGKVTSTTPVVTMRKLVNGQKSTVTLQPSKTTTTALPVDTAGKMRSLRAQIDKGYPDAPNVDALIREDSRKVLNSVLHQDPVMKAADDKFSDITKRQITPMQEKGPASVVFNAGQPPSADLLKSATSHTDWNPHNVNRMLQQADAASPGTSQGILSARLREALMDSAEGRDLGDAMNSQTRRFANAVGLPGTAARSEFNQLSERALRNQGKTAAETSTKMAEEAQLVEALARAGQGRNTVGATITEGGRQAGSQMGPIAAKAGGTNPLLALVPPLSQAVKRKADLFLGDALADTSGKQLRELLENNPTKQRLIDALRIISTGAGLQPWEQ